MGQCFACCKTPFISQIALKFPHGTNGIHYESNAWKKVDINEWLSGLYVSSTWTDWIIYNDDTHQFGINKHTKGHCKGIVAWNASRVSWLIHSVPNFPRQFNGSAISPIEKSETIYGQSFYYMECDIKSDTLSSIFNQLYVMEAHIFMKHGAVAAVVALDQTYHKSVKKIYTIMLDDTVTHIAKPPHIEIDIYSDHLVKAYPEHWSVETWIRGHHIETPCPLITDIKSLHHDTIMYTESQDHSKWAVSENYVWIGDLNRMTSQFKRGGGGVVIHDKNISNALRSLFGTVFT